MYKLYHATNYDNFLSILNNGITSGTDGIVYMCLTPEDAIKFLFIRGVRDILVIEVKVPKNLDNTIIETFDHSEEFFKCRCFGSTIPISLSRIGKMYHYIL